MTDRDIAIWVVCRHVGGWAVRRGGICGPPEGDTFAAFEQAVIHARGLALERRPADVFLEDNQAGALRLLVSFG